MTDEPENLVLRLLQEIRADVAEMKLDLAEVKRDVASIKETLRQHGIRLDTHGANFDDISNWLREIRGLLKDYSVAQELRRITADLSRRVSALENRQQ
jgi:DNA repair ATPase RecN